MTNKEFAALIKPAGSRGDDKYSRRLYQRVLENGRESAYLMAHNGLEVIKPDIAALKSGYVPAVCLALGQRHADNWFYGNRLAGIVRRGAGRHDFAYSPAFNVAEWVDVTDWFWNTYRHYGLCRFYRYSVHEWLQINRNSRKCLYCGKHERRTVVFARRVERQEHWT